MSWREIIARFPSLPADTSPIVEAFRDAGIENTIEEGDTIGGCAVETDVTTEILGQLQARLESLGMVEFIDRPYEETDWQNVWKQYFKPRRIGRRFVVVPSWEEYSARPDDLILDLDPGQAFGTGDHPTTRLCLELLEDAQVSDRDVADVGCGSGILAIAAVRLGAASVVGVDVDPIAVAVARENAIRNQVEIPFTAGDGVRALLAMDSTPPLGHVYPQDETPLTVPPDRPLAVIVTPRYDVVISNIISAVLIRIAGDVAAVIRDGGRWIVSGIIEMNWPDVLRVAESEGFCLVESRVEDGWVAARFDRIAN